MSKKKTIAELENILNKEEDVSIEILPSGEIHTRKSKRPRKVITMRENLGGEYSGASHKR